MRRTRIATVAVAIVAGTLAGCATSTQAPDVAQLSKAPSATFAQLGIDAERDTSAQVIARTRALGASIARASRSEPNTVVAPFGAMVALGMIRAGAQARAADEIDRGVGPYRPAALAALIGQLGVVGGDPGDVDGASSPPVPVFRQAVGAFLRESTPPRRPYLDELATYVNTGVYPLDFAAESSRRAVNEWFAVNTGGDVTSSSAPMDAKDSLSVLSSMFFAAGWVVPFDPSKTSNAPFTTASGRITTVPMMQTTSSLRRAFGAGWSAVQLDYTGAGVAMQLVVPTSGASVDSVVDAGVLTTATARLATTPAADLSLRMPRWTTTARTDLVPIVRDLGMHAMFRGDLDGIADDASVSHLVQAGSVSAGELGTAIRSADPTPAGVPAAPPPSGPLLVVDHPFAYQIVDTATGLPLFLGVVTDPAAR